MHIYSEKTKYMLLLKFYEYIGYPFKIGAQKASKKKISNKVLHKNVTVNQ